MINWLVSLGDNVHDLNGGLQGACMGGNIDIAEWMINLGARDFNTGLAGACDGKNKKMAKMMVSLGANRCTHCRKSMDEHL